MLTILNDLRLNFIILGQSLSWLCCQIYEDDVKHVRHDRVEGEPAYPEVGRPQLGLHGQREKSSDGRRSSQRSPPCLQQGSRLKSFKTCD